MSARSRSVWLTPNRVGCRPPLRQPRFTSSGRGTRAGQASNLHRARGRHSVLGARVVQPGVGADRGRCRGFLYALVSRPLNAYSFGFVIDPVLSWRVWLREQSLQLPLVPRRRDRQPTKLEGR
jgi:hypothetical protein